MLYCIYEKTKNQKTQKTNKNQKNTKTNKKPFFFRLSYYPQYCKIFSWKIERKNCFIVYGINTPTTHIEHIEHQPTTSIIMSRTRGYTPIYKVSCAELGVPAGVVIGRSGGTINLMKSLSRAQMRIRNNVIEVMGGSRELMTAKNLLARLKENYSNGVIGLRMSQPTRKPRRKIRVNTDAATGWSNLEANREAESKTSSEPKKVVRATQNSFAGLDFDDSDTDSDESHAEEQTIATQEVKEEFPALPSSPAIKLSIREKVDTSQSDTKFKSYLVDRREKRVASRTAAGLPVNASWADICDEEDERRMNDHDDEGMFLQNY